NYIVVFVLVNRLVHFCASPNRTLVAGRTDAGRMDDAEWAKRSARGKVAEECIPRSRALHAPVTWTSACRSFHFATDGLPSQWMYTSALPFPAIGRLSVRPPDREESLGAGSGDGGHSTDTLRGTVSRVRCSEFQF